MKKIIGIGIAVLTLVLVLAYVLIRPFAATRDQSALDHEWYAEVVTDFQEVNVGEITTFLADDEEFVLYAGRSSCLYCHQFLKTYSASPKSLRPKIYFLDTEDREDKDIQAFRQQFTIKTVPYMAYFSDGQEIDRLEKGSKTSLEEMKTFFRMVRSALAEK
ncbi:TPA: hypothetical protein TXJ16_000527 [Streptococcus suis]|nr:hypothetical protein [Streptococcus suis]